MACTKWDKTLFICVGGTRSFTIYREQNLFSEFGDQHDMGAHTSQNSVAGLQGCTLTGGEPFPCHAHTRVYRTQG